MSLYPGIAAVMDIDKLSSFQSKFGLDTLHSHLSLFCLCLQARTEILYIRFILGIREVLKGAAYSPRIVGI